eukprot:TRINITY_DN3166_c0_g1_i1.p1 TRINITY_DN3166_c0_g1~~TRINITY_DN3166_c0_g1_i1.p1  ORF type:complete len:268 (+),score=97.98 TRINITY_DN3166_c0_g1_i1:114-806(+)
MSDFDSGGAGDIFDYIFKLIVVGDSGVGKSSLTVRLSEDVFYKDYASTVAIDFRMCAMQVGGKRVRLQIWDTAGQERFSAVASSFYRGANGVLLCFDVTDRKTFENVEMWLERVQRDALAGTPFVLVGCKVDLERHRAVSAAEAAVWVRDHADQGLRSYVETSALSSANVSAAFEALVTAIMGAWDEQERSRRAALQEQAGVSPRLLAAPPPHHGRVSPQPTVKQRRCAC